MLWTDEALILLRSYAALGFQDGAIAQEMSRVFGEPISKSTIVWKRRLHEIEISARGSFEEKKHRFKKRKANVIS